MDEFNVAVRPRGKSVGAGKGTDFPVVGIGASAGGLPATLRLLENLPSANGMAFVVILHLSPTHESTASSVLQRATKMPVLQVTEPTRIEKDHVYVIPPNRHMTMVDGMLGLEPLDRPVGKHVAVDIFFRTLADSKRERAVAIVLSGTGTDGAVGVCRIKEQGGVTLVQTPSDAEHEGMPLAAIATGTVDFVLPVAEMPQKLIDLWANAQAIELPPEYDGDQPAIHAVEPHSLKEAEDALQKVIGLIRDSTGHDFRHYKRATVLRRIERRLQVRGVPTLPAYRSLLEADAEEHVALLKDMLIGVTNFFRDREYFDTLERLVIPELFRDKNPLDQVRAWVAACSTGEEAYSVAMLLAGQASQMAKPPDIQVFASDIDQSAIARGRAGVYPSSIVTDVSPSRLREFFTEEGEHYRVRKSLRDKMLFAPHNVLRDPPFSRLDLICCRNLLIYLNREVQSHLLEMFHFALNPGGYLFLGSSESADMVSNFFTPVDKKARIYRAKATSRSARPGLSLPSSGPLTRSQHTSPVEAPKRQFSFAEVHQRVLAQYAPPSVIVSRDSDIVHMSDRAGRFLRHAGGEPSRNIVSLVLPELRLELRTAIFQASQSNKSVEAQQVQLTRDDRKYFVNMVVRPFHDSGADADFLLVLFDEVEQTMSQEIARAPGENRDAVLAQLEEELQRTKDILQDTIEHSAVSTEELRASNEELQAINEELRSATEELETSKEELQSVNEELITVNYELKVKVEETGKVNDDLNNLIASNEIATIFVDGGMRIKRYTPRAADIFNIIPSDNGRSLLDITHKLDYPDLAQDAFATFETLRPVEREVRSLDGHYYIVRMLPYRTTEDRIEGAVMTYFDITRRRKAEARMLAAEGRMRLVAESTRDYAIITFDVDGKVTSWNKGAERVFGYSEEEMLGQPVEIIYSDQDRADGVPAAEMRRALEEGRAEDERWHRRKDGTRLYCSGVTSPLRDGEFHGYAKIARDQTERVRLEDERQAALSDEHAGRTHAEMTSAQKDEFLAVMSHELRHPLNLIHLNLELLARLPETWQSPLALKATEAIRGAVSNQAKVIEDLLDLSRLNTGKLSLSKSEVDLPMLVNDIVEASRHDPAANDRNITLEVCATPLLIHADRVRIEQVVLNLLGNAIKFTTPGGNIRITVAQEEANARLDVVDDGKGIPAEFLPQVFSMFGQATSVTTRSTGGLGIGLALVHQITDLHGGRVEVTSDGSGKGARFTLWLPLSDLIGPAVSTVGKGSQGTLSGLRILLIDDSADIAEAFSSLLELGGAKVIVANSATAGLARLPEHEFDLVVSDIAMPGMDGYDFISRVRSNPAYAALPAIAVSGLGRESDLKRSMEAGFSAHINKPVSIDVLIRTIEEVVGRPS
jgi:two-component system CheB/CheR fusion protein